MVYAAAAKYEKKKVPPVLTGIINMKKFPSELFLLFRKMIFHFLENSALISSQRKDGFFLIILFLF